MRIAMLVLSVVAVCLLLSPRPESVAQEKKKPDTRTVASVTESGPYRSYDTNFSVRAHRKSSDTGEVTLFIEVKAAQPLAGEVFYFNILPESATAFLELHRKAVERNRTLVLAKSVEGARLEWSAKGYLTGDLTLINSWPLDDWSWNSVPFKSAPEAFAQALKDVEALKANKPVTPW